MKRALLVLALAAAACAPDFRGASRALAAQSPPPRDPVFERRASYYDAEHSRLRREWHVEILFDNSDVLHGKDLQYYADGKLEYERDYDHGTPTGRWRTWWPNGNPRMEASYGASELQPMRWWYENGQLSSEGQARNGLKEGAWTFWHPSGAKLSEGRFSAGRREGPWTFWNEDGSLKESGEYRGDARVGDWTKS